MLRRFRLPILFFLVGMVLTLVGAGKKMMHLENADLFLYLGIGVECAALFLLAIILFIYTSKNRT